MTKETKQPIPTIKGGWYQAVSDAHRTGDAVRAAMLGALSGALLDLHGTLEDAQWDQLYRRVSHRVGIGIIGEPSELSLTLIRDRD